MPDLELFQFALSHYNEKARWALDWKALPHVRRSLLPGPHKFAMTRLSGQDKVPVLRDGETVIPGSSQILAHLEARYAAAPLLPADPTQRERALAVQREFDEEVGPAVRLARFHAALGDSRYFPLQFTHERSAFVRTAYRVVFPLVRGVMMGEMQITDENAARAGEIIDRALERVACEAGPEGYLAGSAFSVADLTAASLLMPVVSPVGGPRMPPPSAAVLAFEARWKLHPGSEWVREIYARHRGKSAEIAG